LKNGKWEQLPDAPHARDHFQAAVCNDRLYLIGGRRSRAPKNTFTDTEKAVDVYDFRTGKWSTLDEGLPTPRAGSFLAAIGDEILVFGGETIHQKAAHREVEALNTKTLQWRSLPGMVQGRHGTGAIHFGNQIFVASGSGNRGGSPELTTHETLLLK
jgi:N-acetylneuraminic acid mutarotase